MGLKHKKLYYLLLIMGILGMLDTIILLFYTNLNFGMLFPGVIGGILVTLVFIILGAGINGEAISLTLEDRLKKGMEYLEEHPDVKVIVSGGQGPQEDIPEAVAMERYLISKGIDKKRILVESKSTSTMENFKFSKVLLVAAKEQDTGRITVITSDFHMLRAKMLARRNGFEPYGISCGTPVSVIANSYIREYFALIKSFLFDR